MAWILALDRGNSSLKVALIDSGAIIGRWREDGSNPEEILRRIAFEVALTLASSSNARPVRSARKRLFRAVLESVTFHGAVFSSVHPRWTKEVRRVLEGMAVSRILEVSPHVAFPFEILVREPRKVGPDRLAAAAGVVAAGDREAIIIDAGTAITVDVLSKKGFLGGAIFPGKELVYRVLHEGTSTLPLVSDKGKAVEPPGRNTKEAIVAGVQWGSVGAVKELVARSRRHVSRNARIWVTGGGGATIAAHLGKGVRWEPDLVFLGLHYLFELNSD